jgi:hypothetical protein
VGDLIAFSTPAIFPSHQKSFSKDSNDVDAMKSIEQIKELYLKVVCV